MTIDSTWLTMFKKETPEAFTTHPPFRYHGVFVDGQIRLMQGPGRKLQTWDDYIHTQFVRHLEKFLDVADTVVVAFDNYEYVPVAKCMTQVARRKHVPVEPFGETSPLPCMVPDPEFWIRRIMNRTFKARVIELVIRRLPALLVSRRPGKKLILDYKDVVEYTGNDDGTVSATELEMRPLGEADVKFTRYADRFEKLVVDSIDGDSVPIALYHHEKCLSRGMAPPRMAVRRLEIKMEDAEEIKRKRAEGKWGPRRTYEYLDITVLYESLRTVAAQCLARVRMPGYEGHEVRMIVALVALTGTDFTRGLPYVSGSAVFDLLVDVWMTLATAYDPAADQFRPDSGHRLVAAIYAAKFPKHCHFGEGYSEVLASLQASKLSAKTKERLASAERIATTVLNVNWVLQYWSCEACPDPISPQFGYRLERPGAAQYADA